MPDFNPLTDSLEGLLFEALQAYHAWRNMPFQDIPAKTFCREFSEMITAPGPEQNPLSQVARGVLETVVSYTLQETYQEKDVPKSLVVDISEELARKFSLSE